MSANNLTSFTGWTKTWPPIRQAYVVAGIGLSLQYILSTLVYYNLLPNVAGYSLNGITRNSTYIIPGVMAVFGLLYFEGKSGIMRVIKSYTVITYNPLWWLFAMGCLIPILFGALYLNDFLYGVPFGDYRLTPPGWEQISRYTPLFFRVAICDEIFWIGFIYPRLLHGGYSPLKASLAIGLLWGMDYLPFLFTQFFVASGLDGPNILLGWLSLTPIYIWLYFKTKSAGLIIVFNIFMQFLFTAIPVLPQVTGDNADVAMANLICLIVGLALWRYFPNGKSDAVNFSVVK